MEDRWVTNLSEDRKRFYLVSSLLDPRTKMLSFCDNKSRENDKNEYRLSRDSCIPLIPVVYVK